MSPVEPAAAALGSSWAPLDLGPIVAGVLSGEIVGPVPTILDRTDEMLLLYPAEVHCLSGEPESCKGWIALNAAASVIERGGRVLYMDFEDGAASIVTRLFALQVLPDAIVERFTYVRPSDPFSAGTFDELFRSRSYELAVIDGLTEGYSLLGLDIASNDDAAKFLAALPRPIADHGAAVLLIDHVAKSKETRGRCSIGAQHKLAGVGVQFGTEVIKALSRTSAGLVKLKIDKDRHGHVRGHAEAGVIALVHITPEGNGERVSVRLEPPESSTTDHGKFRPTRLMERISRFLEAEDEPASRNAVRRAVPNKAESVDAALQMLVDENYVERRLHGQAQKHSSIHPYRQEDDPNEPSPNRVPTESRTRSPDRVPPSPPLTGDSDSDPVSGTRSNGNRVPDSV